MKTKTNFRKAAVRTAAVVVSFILISFTVSAQEFWKRLLTNSSFNEIAIAIVKPGNVEVSKENSNTIGTEWKNFDMAFDPALELEGWMSSKKHFGVTDLNDEVELNLFLNEEIHLLDLNHSADTSEPLKLEAWMVHNELWMKQ